MPNPWFRLYSEFATDPKVQMMPESLQRRLVMIMCMRCSNDNATLHAAEIAFVLRISEDELTTTKEVFLEKGFIDEDWNLLAWQSSYCERPPAHIWREIRTRIFSRDNFTCHYCGVHGVRLECDHVVPVVKGGFHEDDNLVTACFACNRSKHSKLVSEWRVI